MENFEKVFGNVDILGLIFEYLDFKDQLRLARVNKQLRNAYEILSSKVHFNSVYLHRWSPSSGKYQSKTVVADNMGVNGYCLQDNQVFRDFQVIYGDRVRHLTLNLKGPFDESCFNAFLSGFANLQSLRACDMNFSKTNLQNCPVDLQELKLKNPCEEADALVEFISKNLNNLRKLKIEYSDDFCCIQHKNFTKMCHLPKLEFLQFRSCFFKGQIEDDLQLAAASNLKQLDICLWKMEYLKSLPVQNLKVLHLGLNQHTNRLFSILTDTCTNLETLILNRIEFGSVKTISLPPKVRELIFFRCFGLRHSSLKKILTEFKITKFCTRQTLYEGIFHDFKISSHIRSLEFDFVKLEKFRSAFENNTQLKELVYNNMYFECGGSMQDLSFNSTSNLQKLDVPYIPPLAAITQLKSLRSLTIRPFHSPRQSWKITDLLNHPTLHEFSIQNVTFALDSAPNLVVHEPPAMSNITRLSITPMYLKNSMNFWLKIFTANKQMTLVCWPIWNERDLSCVYLMLNNEYFPRELKFMDICCLTIDCAKLRRSSELERREYLGGIRFPEQIGFSIDQLMSNNPNIARRYRIILSWEYEYNLTELQNI